MSTEQNLEAVVWVQRRALTQDAEGTGEGGREGRKREGTFTPTGPTAS